MKGIIGNKKGLLLPYQEVAEKLSWPKEYIFQFTRSEIKDHLNLVFVDISSFKFEFKGDWVIYSSSRASFPFYMKEAILRMEKKEINRIFGTAFKNPSLKRYMKTGEEIESLSYHRDDIIFYQAMKRNENNLFIFISEAEEIVWNDEGFFVETE